MPASSTIRGFYYLLQCWSNLSSTNTCYAGGKTLALPWNSLPRINLYSRRSYSEARSSFTIRHVKLRDKAETASLPKTSTPASGSRPTWEQNAEAVRAMDLPEQMRQLMRRITHPIVVVRAHKKVTEQERNIPSNILRMTISSFNTVCLRPVPIVSMNIKLPSATWQTAIDNDGKFFLDFMHSAPPCAVVADAYARKSNWAKLPSLESGSVVTKRKLELDAEEGEHVPAQASKGIDATIPNSGEDVDRRSASQSGKDSGGSESSHVADFERLIRQKQSEHSVSGLTTYQTMASIACTLLPDKQIEVEDHLIICARVDEMSINKRWAAQAGGLMYFNQAFHLIGAKMNFVPFQDLVEENGHETSANGEATTSDAETPDQNIARDGA